MNTDKKNTVLSISSLFKQSFVYTLVSFVQKGMVFLLLPLYTHILSSKEYGIVSIVTTISGFFTAFYALGQTASASRFYFEYKDDEIKRKRFIGTIVSFLLMVSIILTLILLVFNHFLIEPFAGGVPFYPFVLLGLINTLFAPLYVMYQQILLMKHNVFRRNANILLNTIILLSLNIICVVLLKKGALGILGVQATVSLIFFITSLVGLRKEMTFGIDIALLKESLKYGLPILPHTVASWVMSMTDRIVLNKYATLSIVGVYNVGCQIAGIVSVISTTINYAYFPWACRQYEKNDQASVDRLSESSKMIIYLLMLVSIIISLYSKEIFTLLIDSEYFKATEIIPMISLGFIFQVIYYSYSNILYYYKSATKFIAVASWISAFVSLSANLLLTPKLGIYGSCIACILAYLSLAFTAYVKSKKYFRVKINFWSINLQVILAIGVAYLVGLHMSFVPKTIYLLLIIYLMGLKYKMYIANVISKIVNPRQTAIS